MFTLFDDIKRAGQQEKSIIFYAHNKQVRSLICFQIKKENYTRMKKFFQHDVGAKRKSFRCKI